MPACRDEAPKLKYVSLVCCLYRLGPPSAGNNRKSETATLAVGSFPGDVGDVLGQPVEHAGYLLRAPILTVLRPGRAAARVATSTSFDSTPSANAPETGRHGGCGTAYTRQHLCCIVGGICRRVLVVLVARGSLLCEGRSVAGHLQIGAVFSSIQHSYWQAASIRVALFGPPWPEWAAHRFAWRTPSVAGGAIQRRSAPRSSKGPLKAFHATPRRISSSLARMDGQIGRRVVVLPNCCRGSLRSPHAISHRP